MRPAIDSANGLPAEVRSIWDEREELAGRLVQHDSDVVHRELRGDLARQGSFARTSAQLGMEPVGQAPDTPDASDVPLIGRIAAGVPIEALEHGPSHLGVPSMMLSASGEHYALEVKGDSMIEDHSCDGDYVIVEKRETVRDGETVVALLEGGEATLKRFYRTSSGIRLQPANTAYEPIITKNVTVQGVVVGILRGY